MQFFITGLPRSRTAWMATYLSMLPRVHCYHEALKGCSTVDQFIKRMVIDIPDARVGNSDSVLPLTNFQELFPNAHTVVIERKIEDVIWSLKQLKIDTKGPAGEVLGMTYAKLDRIEGLRVPFNELDARLPDICMHIGVGYDPHKHMMMRKMNVQTMDFSPDPKALSLWM